MCVVEQYPISSVFYIQVNAVTKNVAYPEFVFDDAELLKRSKSVSNYYTL